MPGMLWKKIVMICNRFEIEPESLMEYNEIRIGTLQGQTAAVCRGEMFEEGKNMMARDGRTGNRTTGSRSIRNTADRIQTFLRCLFLLMICTVFMGTTAFAATEKINTVKLSFTCDPVPKAGEAPGTVTAKTSSKEFTVKSAEYTNDVEVWSLGDRPRVKAVLEAADGYRFSYTTSSHFKLSGRGADFIKAKISDSGSTLNLECYLNQADGKPGTIQGLDWSGFRARWDKADEDVKHYEVRLYRNKNLVTTVTASGTSYDFRNEITRSGDYTFRVRSIAKYADRAGDWSGYSDENTVTERQVSNNGSGSWVQNQYGWWYRYYNGGYPSNTWEKINNTWYYFNRDGYMLTGWQQINGSWYYLGSSGTMTRGWQAVSGRWYYMNGDGVMLTGWQYLSGHWYYLDGSGAMLTGFQFINGRWYYLNSDGVMLTGWQFINGAWYYLDGSGAVLTGWQYINGRWYYMNDSGIMLTGWQFINGSWYYLDSSGAMYANQTTPDGYYVDGSGRRN
jgi:glucan-binding YG repeat protein